MSPIHQSLGSASKLRRFPIGRNERSLPKEHYKSVQAPVNDRALRARPESACLTGKRFTLKERTLAIEVLLGSRMPIIVPAGAIIHVVSRPGASVSLCEGPTVEILWADRRLEMFTCDIRMRGTGFTD